MDARSWLGRQAAHDPHRWVAPATKAVATHGGFLAEGPAFDEHNPQVDGTLLATASPRTSGRHGTDQSLAVRRQAPTTRRAA